MKKLFAILTIAFTLLLFACNASVPVEPNEADWSEYPTEFTVNDITFGLDDFPVGVRTAAYDPDGSLMTDAELIIYFSWNITDAVIGWEHSQACDFYDLLHAMMTDIEYPPPYTYPQFMVWYMESHGYDVPDTLTVGPDC